MSRDPLTRMDVDTRWMFTDHARRLQTAHPETWPTYWCAYQAVLAESWWQVQRVTLATAWSPVIPGTLEDALAALQAADLLDKAGKPTLSSWKKWFEPALERIEKRSAAGRAGAEKRWSEHGKRTPKAMRPHSVGDAPRQPATPATPATPASQEPHPNGAGDDPPDVLDAWFRLTGSWPSRKVIPWLEELSRDHGEVEVSSALAAELLADDDRKTLLSRTQARLERDEHHAAKVRAAREAEAAAAERARIEAMPEEQRRANMEWLGAMLRESGVLPGGPK